MNRIALIGMIVFGVAFCAGCWYAVLYAFFGASWIRAVAAIVFGLVTFSIALAVGELLFCRRQ